MEKTITLIYNEEKYRYWVRFSDTAQLYWIRLSQMVDFVEEHKNKGYKINFLTPQNN